MPLRAKQEGAGREAEADMAAQESRRLQKFLFFSSETRDFTRDRALAPPRIVPPISTQAADFNHENGTDGAADPARNRGAPPDVAAAGDGGQRRGDRLGASQVDPVEPDFNERGTENARNRVTERA
jgi:hypothetical protein